MDARKFVTATAAAVIAAAAVSACAPAAEKPWPSAGAAGTSSPAAAAVEKPVWSWPKWTGKVNANNNPKGIQFGGTLVPGIVVAQQVAESRKSCTIGVAVQAVDVGNAFLTAGHCDRAPGSPLFLYPEADTTDADAKQLSATFVKTDTHVVPDVGTGLVSDSTLLPVPSIDPAATKIAGKYGIAGVLTTAAVKQLPINTPVCFDGSVSGLVCGPLRSSQDNGVIVFQRASEHGDSGAPVFLVDQHQRAVLIGVLSTGDDAGTDRLTSATYLEPALMRVGASVALDPSEAPLAGPDFSPRVGVS